MEPIIKGEIHGAKVQECTPPWTRTWTIFGLILHSIEIIEENIREEIPGPGGKQEVIIRFSKLELKLLMPCRRYCTQFNV